MATEKKVVEAIVSAEVKQKQTVLDLDTQGEVEIVLAYKRYAVNSDVPIAEQLIALKKMVSPEAKQVEALVAFASSQSYQDAKAKAFGKGNYLNAQLRSAITGIMGNMGAYSENSAKENFERWLTGYKAKKVSAVKMLELAKASINEKSELSDL